jgi:uncharacterized integral membrane protein
MYTGLLIWCIIGVVLQILWPFIFKDEVELRIYPWNFDLWDALIFLGCAVAWPFDLILRFSK